LRYAPISHPKWNLQRAEIISLDDSLIQAAGFAVPRAQINGEPHVMFSSGVPVRVGLPKRVSFSRIPVGSYRGRQLVARQLIRK
jgi:uncharacterized protein YqjF (DUF2071 family)